MHTPNSNCVAVLLATFNGEVYLEKQIDSLKKQKGVCVHLFWWDDGSTDRTKELLSTQKDLLIDYRGYGRNLGPNRAFLFLLENPKLESFSNFAFCDQDDVWLENKLHNGINYIKKNPECVLYSTKRIILRGEEIRAEKFPRDAHNLSFEELIFENKCYGNTLIFDQRLRMQFLGIDTHGFQMPHDWLLARIALAIGLVYVDSDAQIIYRLHSSNVTGKRVFTDLKYLRLTSISTASNYYLYEYERLLGHLADSKIESLQTSLILSRIINKSRILQKKKILSFRSNPWLNLFFIFFVLLNLVPSFKIRSEVGISERKGLV